MIFILDITMIFHDKQHTPEQYNKCKETNAKTFVDDNLLLTKPKIGQSIYQAVSETM